MGMQKHNEDFGQTLGRWGMGPGPYVVLPILGPSTARDTVGLVADGYAYMPFWVPRTMDWNHRVAWRNGLTILDTINIRANLLGTTNLVEEAALDRYTFIRDAYLQRRRSLVYDGNPPPEATAQRSAARSRSTSSPRASLACWRSCRWRPYAAPRLQVVEPKVPANYDAVLSASR